MLRHGHIFELEILLCGAANLLRRHYYLLHLRGLDRRKAIGLWYGEPHAISNAIDYAKHRSRSHHAVIRVYDDAGDLIETHEHTGDFKEP